MTLCVSFSFCFLIFLLLPIACVAQTYGNISLGSTLTASFDNSSWVSPSGDFAFGFQQINNYGFLLAIWFNKLPERTIVWSANRNNPVQAGSQVLLTTDGQLVLNDQSGAKIWNANIAGSRASYAAMLDTGNFVLASYDSTNLWQSFHQPTDTILPAQTLNLGNQLIARYSETNYSQGRFKLTLDTDGNIYLYTRKLPFDTSNMYYWSTQTFAGIGYQMIFNHSGYLYLAARNGSVLTYLSSNVASIQDFYQRASMDYDGVFVQYIYPKTTSSSGNRSLAWMPLFIIPSNICTSMNEQNGGGVCGYNSYCRLGDDQRPICQCPPGYTLLNPDDVRLGCKQNFVSHKCGETQLDKDLFDLNEMPNTDFRLSDYESFPGVSEDWCRLSCLSDCYCAAAFFISADCYKKRIPLLNGRTDPSTGGKVLIKVGKDNATSTAVPCSKKKDQSTLFLAGSVLLGSSIFVNILLVAATLMFIDRLNWRKWATVQPKQVLPATNPRNFTYSELELATGGFQEELGSGAFGTVYKGALHNEDGDILIAVKKLDKTLRSEGEQEFRTEVSAIGGTNHKNLVKLLGFCDEGEHRLLVYEYMSNGSLANFLFGDCRPNFQQRTEIALGIARGLFYLHEECSTQIMHCDIKPQNILLDQFLKAKISDFGLAKLLKTDQIRTTTAIRGTKGYVAPEWFRNMPVTVKVDVYSFGILLLELICCRRNFLQDANEENQMVLADWAYDCYKAGKLNLLVEDDDEEARKDMKRVENLITVAIWCIQDDPSQRPAMKKVMQMLEGSIHCPVPPDPSPSPSSIGCSLSTLT